MDEPECPLCLEPLAIDDINFYPCVCRYQICRFCWHRIRMDEGGKCPHCRTVYSENPAEYNPPSPEQINQLKTKGKKKSQDKKQKIIESRKNLTDVRVLQKNLIFVLGLSPRLADPEILKKSEYFGKYGKIHKVVLNHHTIYNGSLGPSVSAYVTYQREEDALRAMQAVNNAFIDGRILKASFGTTKYCSFFLRGLQCTKPDCMYLHELGDTEASFTKEDMQQGKHQDYEIATLESQSITVNKEYPLKKSTRSKQGGHTGSGGSGHNKINSNKTAPPAESALPLTSNWGSKGDKPRKKVHKQLSVPHHCSEPRPLQRTLSNPSSRSHEDKDPQSLSTSPASTVSLEGRREKGGGGRGKRGGGDSVEEDESQYHFVSTSSQCSDVTTDFDEEADDTRKEGLQGGNMASSFIGREEEEEEEEGGYDDIEEEGEKVEEKSVTWKRNDDEDEDSTTLNVFKALGVSPTGGHDFGNLGVSWSRDPPSPHSSKSLSQRDGEGQLSSPPPLPSSSPVFMSMPWEVPHESSTNTLTDLLSTNYRVSPPLMSKGLVDERQRLASASYVNYGPTTNNHLDELHTKSSIESPRSSLLLDNKVDSFQSSLDDDFQSLFSAGSMQSLENALQVTSLDVTSSAGPSSSSKLFSLFQNPSPPSSGGASTERKSLLPTLNLTPAVGHFDSAGTNGEWPKFDDNNSNKQKGGTTIAPPPGFGNCKPFPKATTPTSAYTLWGEDKDDKSSSLVQAPPLPAAPGSRPVPIGAIQHNLLEASLFNSSSPNSSSSYSLKKVPETLTSSHHVQQRPQQHQHLLYPPGSSPHGNKTPLLPQPVQPAAKTAQQHNLKQQQQRAMLLRQQQQQQYQKHHQVQLAAIQQQMYLYQQQVLAHQQASGGVSQKRPSSSYPPAVVPVPQSTAANAYKTVPVPHQTAASNPHPTPLYFGGWYPAYATWGLPAAPGLAVAPSGHNIGRLAGGTVPGLQGSRSVAGVTGVLGQTQGIPPSGSQVEQKFQNTTLN
ncbi:PREDICTED: apoptotic chromatin condensation inducer in the nucleus-like isoform X2 [Amphimedon queenslandica]|uniref:CCR4-NOT transcription complex subunit 4 n=1 Tax=Amphimedon queenslandica TaxID=400682 RepID=A0AAN0IWS3_AMPQE|nr:PREDICTED: apoptotic chromatin condensation inducer in the nucleus-like isoform X2 [Amphimedon queenslandica]|eukprot:XP_019848886.1 PREDICTED: apoptotic chromatin condensation inducer in the nucleus-like isoform X2 [Amphimedon queenslandica]